MRTLDRLRAFWRALFRSPRVDDELAEEMRFHIERETAALVARGLSPDAAHREARRTFGSVDAAHEQARDERPGAGVRETLRDLRFGVRLLRKSPGFALTTIAVVAVALGGATAIFSVVYGVLLAPLPFRDAGRLVDVWLVRQHGVRNLPAAADAIALRDLRGVFVGVAYSKDENLELTGDGEPRRLRARSVSPDLLQVLGASPALGRGFVEGEDVAGREHELLISDALWRGRFGGDSAIVGRQVMIDDAPYTVIGVMPPDFGYPASDYEAWVPRVLEPGEPDRAVTNNYDLVARLAPGVTVAQARAATHALAALLAPRIEASARFDLALAPMLADIARDVRPMLYLLLGAVTFLLAIAAVNLSNLFAARARARRGELAVRLALGASRWRIVRQAFAESAPVLLAGGAVGVALAWWGVRALVAAAPPGLPRVEHIALSAPVLGYALLLLAVTGLVASLGPVVQAWRSDFSSVSKDGGRGSTAGRGDATARRLGVAIQIAFALPLLVGGTLLVRSAINVMNVPPGFRTDHVTTVGFQPSRARHRTDADLAGYYARVIAAVRGVPGVANVSLVNRIPLSGGQTNQVWPEDASGAAGDATNVDSRTVSPDYFATMGIRLVAGRGFTDHDDADAPPVAIVDERFARAAWPGQSAIGKRLRGVGSDSGWTVVGVVTHLHTAGLETDPLPQVYWSYRQWPQKKMVLAVLGAGDAPVSAKAVIAAMRTIDREQSVYDVQTMDAIVDRSLARRRLTTWITVAFAGLALLLATVGIYGVVAYGVASRVREIGIRIALGATRCDIVRLVVGGGLVMPLVGAAVGLVVALLASGMVGSMVYGVGARDVVSLAGSVVVLLGVAAAASYVPARRAAAVDPGGTLRGD